MTNDPNPAMQNHGDYERRDIGVNAVIYFLIGLAVFVGASAVIVIGLYHFLDRRTEAHQAPISPMITNAPTDTRKLPVDYRDYLKEKFPAPQLEIDERTQLDSVRIDEEDKLATYDYIDKNAGTVRIPIERAMDLIVQRGLPTRIPGGNHITAASDAPIAAHEAEKKKKKK